MDKDDVILSKRNINIDFHILEKPPVMGAVLGALEYSLYCGLYGGTARVI